PSHRPPSRRSAAATAWPIGCWWSPATTRPRCRPWPTANSHPLRWRPWALPRSRTAATSWPSPPCRRTWHEDGPGERPGVRRGGPMSVAPALRHPLCLAHLSVLGLSPPQVVEVAAAAGFGLVGLRLAPAVAGQAVFPMLGDAPLMRETLARLDALGVAVHDVELV